MLKFLLQAKHLARFVLGLVAVSKFLHRGHWNRKYPSLILWGNSSMSAMSMAIGMRFRRFHRHCLEYRFCMVLFPMAGGIRSWPG